MASVSAAASCGEAGREPQLARQAPGGVHAGEVERAAEELRPQTAAAVPPGSRKTSDSSAVQSGAVEPVTGSPGL